MIRNRGRSKPQALRNYHLIQISEKRSDSNKTHSNIIQMHYNDKFLICNDCNHNCLTYVSQEMDSGTVVVISFYNLT